MVKFLLICVAVFSLAFSAPHHESCFDSQNMPIDCSLVQQ